jgi:hypothetical protein
VNERPFGRRASGGALPDGRTPGIPFCNSSRFGGKSAARSSIGCLIPTEALQGFDKGRDFNAARKPLPSLTVVELGGRDGAMQAAKNFDTLRRLGVTVRKTIDAAIATR